MEIEVKLFASFRKGRFKSEVRSYPTPPRIREVVAELDIAEQNVGIILLNGEHSCLDQLLTDKDILSLLPQFGGG